MTSETVPFSELLQRAKAGEDGAWKAIFARLGAEEAEGAILLGLARRVLPEGDRARAFVESRDLMQSALRSGWLDLASFSGSTEAEFFAWMGAILRRKLGRVVRKRQPRPASEAPLEDESAAGGAEPEETPLGELIREEVHERLREAIAALPEDQRAVMELRLRGLQAPDIALMLGLKAAAVRKRESRAMARLRELLGLPGGEESAFD